MDEKKQRKNNYLTDKIARVGSRRRAILSYNKFDELYVPHCKYLWGSTV